MDFSSAHFWTTIGSAIAVATFVWRIVVWRSKSVEARISKVEEKVDKVDDKLDDLSKAVYELRGEVKGRTYSEMERMIQNTESR